MRKGKWSIATLNLLAKNNWCDEFFFYICYNAGGSTKHSRRSKVKRRDEEWSSSDASTPKKRGKMRTYLWACPVNPHPPTPSSFPLPHGVFRSRRWACIFRLKWCTVGIHNAMARTGLETNSSGDACCLWYRISLSADENMKTNSEN